VAVWGAASPVVSPLSFALGNFGFDLFFLFFNYENNFLEMQKITCSQLKIDLAEIKDLKNEFDLEVERVSELKNIDGANELKKEIEETFKLAWEKLLRIDVAWVNPETNEQKDIKISIFETIREVRDFYVKHNLSVPNEQEFREIAKKHRKEMMKEMETYGYNTALIIPVDLPDLESLNKEMAEGYGRTLLMDSGKWDRYSGLEMGRKAKSRIRCLTGNFHRGGDYVFGTVTSQLKDTNNQFLFEIKKSGHNS